MPPFDPITGLLFVFLNLLDMVFGLVFWGIILSVVLSWLVHFNVINTRNPYVTNILHALDRVIEPMYRPIRRVLPSFGGLDLSPMVVMLAVLFIQGSIIPYLKGTILYFAAN